MNDFFDSIKGLLDSLEQKAADAVEKGAQALESAAKWLRGLTFSEGLVACPPDEMAVAEDCLKRCKELAAPKSEAAVDADKTKLDPATTALLIQLATMLIEAWIRRRQQK